MLGKLITALLIVTSGLTAQAEPVYYGGFRIVRETPGVASKPVVMLPASYARVSGAV